MIAAVDTPTDWVSSLVLVEKPNGKLRICIDPKKLNKALKSNHYPLQVIEDILPDLAQAKIFSLFDVKNGYWHVELDEESSFLTTFETPHASHLALPQHQKYFQQNLEQVLEKSCLVYMSLLMTYWWQAMVPQKKKHTEIMI